LVIPGNARGEELWETADLTGRLCHALDIAMETVGLLAADGFVNPDDPANKIVPEKIIGETAFLLFASSVVRNGAGVNERIERLAALLMPYARNQKILLNICLHPAVAMEYAQAHACLKYVGYPDARFDAMLLKSINAQAGFGRERTPHRMLEQAWIKKTGGYPVPADDEISKVIAHSVLNQPIDLLHGTRDDMYAFTHALMYVSGFNVSPWPMPRSRGVILSEAESMLARCLQEQDYDLAGEVLLAWPLTGQSWSATAVFALRILTQVEDEAGFLPSPATRVDTMAKLRGESRKKYLFATAYHTAYVMGLLCATALQPGRRPPLQISTELSIPGSAAIILTFLSECALTQYWYKVFTKLKPIEQDGLAGLLLDMALISNIRLQNYQAVYQLIAIADELGIVETAILTQAAELLDRLILFGAS